MDALSFTGKKWLVGADARDAAADGSHVARILAAGRGIQGLVPGSIPLLFGMDGAHFPDLGRAVDRIREAVRKKEKVGIFGDYDCDGVTSTAQMIRYFRRRGLQPVVRLPHRLDDGYGLKPKFIEAFAQNGVTLLITVDTGITAEREVELAAQKGMDVIVLDHHRLPEVLPSAHALLHPALAPGFTDAHPAAAGVTWSVVSALEAADGNADWPDRETDIALAAIGTVADLVPLTGGNRLLVHRGLQALGRIQSGAIPLLLLQSGLTPPLITSRDLAFRVAPRLNAAGRMADPVIALQALLGDQSSLLQLEDLNTQRQLFVQEMIEPLLPLAAKSTDPFLLFTSPLYAPGICGLLAGKLCERFGKPTLIAHAQDGRCMASLRSVPAYNVTEGLARSADLLLSYGGHAMAAGCTFAEAHTEELRARLNADVARSVQPEDLIPVMTADLHVDPAHLSLALCEQLRALEPFGQGNPEPLFFLQNISLQMPRKAGKDGSHLQGTIAGKKLIAFRMGEFLDRLRQPVDVLCRVSVDTWQGSRSAQLCIEDIRHTVPASAIKNAEAALGV
jgi:single-stranded-DNA-specific exonuclease